MLTAALRAVRAEQPQGGESAQLRAHRPRLLGQLAVVGRGRPDPARIAGNGEPSAEDLLPAAGEGDLRGRDRPLIKFQYLLYQPCPALHRGTHRTEEGGLAVIFRCTIPTSPNKYYYYITLVICAF